MVVWFDEQPGTRAVTLPSSSPEVLVLELESVPGDLDQTFTSTRRHLHVPAENKACVRCRYRLYRQHDPQGEPLPWPAATALFPEADRIEVRRGDATSGTGDADGTPQD